ncbi:MAG: cation transporter [Flavobacterium sp.]|nr:cation transporter [Flavobacterium sp.]
MKTIKTLFISLFTTLLIWSCKEKTAETIAQGIEKKEIKTENLQTASFTVNGMTCAVGCAKTIQEELSKLEGVQKAEVNFEKKTATVSFDKTIQTPEKLTESVEKTGDGKTYTVSNLKI